MKKSIYTLQYITADGHCGRDQFNTVNEMFAFASSIERMGGELIRANVLSYDGDTGDMQVEDYYLGASSNR